MTKFHAALAVSILAVLATTVGSGTARGAFPGTSGKIVFVNDRNGTPSIFTMNADGTGIAQLVANQPQGAFPSWSPDGKTILFSVLVSDDPGPAYELWMMKANGTNIHRCLPETSDRPVASTWSPNGRKIAFYERGYLWVTNATGTGTHRLVRADFIDAAPSWSRRGPIAFDRGGSIWTVNAGGGALHRLGRGGGPSWSPDGRELAFAATPPGGANNDLYVMRADGSGRHRLTATATANEVQPAWSPNGVWISYSGRNGVYAIRPNGTRRRLVASKGWQSAWSAHSNALVFAQQTSQWDGLIFRIDLNGTHRKQLLRPRLDASPKWSPSGDRVAFTRDGVVNVVNADGSALHSIGLSGADPAWSPDGSRLVVGSGLELVIANSDGTAPSHIALALDPANFVSVWDPDWSPDGTRIAFVATEVSGTQDLFLVTPAGSSLAQVPLSCSTQGSASPSWKPDGAWLAFDCGESVAVAHADGSLLTTLTPGRHATLAWSPDRSQIVFSEQSGEDPAQLFVVRADGSVRQQLTTGPGASDQPDWQPLP